MSRNLILILKKGKKVIHFTPSQHSRTFIELHMELLHELHFELARANFCRSIDSRTYTRARRQLNRMGGHKHRIPFESRTLLLFTYLHQWLRGICHKSLFHKDLIEEWGSGVYFLRSHPLKRWKSRFVE